MASCEYLTYRAVCPCGLGTLERVVESPNYPFGRASVSVPKFNCAHCQPHWTSSADGKRLIHAERNCPMHQALQAAYRSKSALYKAMAVKKIEALRAELQAANLKSKAAERRYLVERGLFEDSYGAYLRSGQDRAASRLDPSQLRSCVSELEQLQMVDKAIDALKAAFDLWLDQHRHEVEFQLHWH